MRGEYNCKILYSIVWLAQKPSSPASKFQLPVNRATSTSHRMDRIRADVEDLKAHNCSSHRGKRVIMVTQIPTLTFTFPSPS